MNSTSHEGWRQDADTPHDVQSLDSAEDPNIQLDLEGEHIGELLIIDHVAQAERTDRKTI